MVRVGVGIAVLVLVSGCAAPVGDTNLTLHQRAELPGGTWYSLSGFEISAKKSGHRTGAQLVAGDQVTVRVEVGNATRAIRANEVAMQFAYRNDAGQEVRPVQLSSSRNVVPVGGHDQISKTYRVDGVPEMFRASRITVVVGAPGYPSVTFSGANP
jgi:hypothetical protein